MKNFDDMSKRELIERAEKVVIEYRDNYVTKTLMLAHQLRMVAKDALERGENELSEKFEGRATYWDQKIVEFIEEYKPGSARVDRWYQDHLDATK